MAKNDECTRGSQYLLFSKCGFLKMSDGEISEKGSQTLTILAISVLSCFVVPSAFYLLSALLCRREQDDDSVQERAVKRCWYSTVGFFTLLGIALIWFLSRQISQAALVNDPFAILGIPSGAEARQIRSAYRKLSLTVHPDKGGDATQFQRIVKAYETLTDPVQRAAWEAGANEDEGTTGLEEVTLKGRSGKVLLLIYVGVLFVALPIGILLYRNSGVYNGSGTRILVVDGEEVGHEVVAEEERFMRRERAKDERRAKKEADERAAAEAARAKAAVKKESLASAKASRAAAEAEIQRKRADEERARNAAETEAAAALSAQLSADGDASFEDDAGSGAAASGSKPSGSQGPALPWTAAETSALAKGLAKYPGGYRNRWTMVSQFVCASGTGRTPDECIARAKEAANRAAAEAAKKVALARAAAEQAVAAGSNAAAKPDDEGAAEGGAGATPSAPGGDDVWSQAQQAQLEEAMRRFPATLDAGKRWAAIADCVTDKSKKQCIARFRTLRAILQQGGAASA